MTNAAVMTASWARHGRRGAMTSLSPGPMNPAGNIPAQGPNDPIGVKVEIFVNSGWEDITGFVYYRSGSSKINISGGRPNEAGRVQPSSCSLELNNRDRRFSPRNPNGPYYGSIGRNTQIRVSRTWNGVRWYRFYGEVPAWPVSADTSGNDVAIRIQASGVLRRISQGTPPVASSMRRNMTSPLRTGSQNLIAYWPLEDSANATAYASGLTGGGQLSVATAGIVPASNSSWLASNPIPTFNKGQLVGSVPSYTSTGVINTQFNIIVPAAGVSGTSQVFELFMSGTIKRWILLIGTAGTLELGGFDQSGTQVVDSGVLSDNLNGTNNLISLQLIQSGNSITYHVIRYDANTFTYANGASGVVSSATVTSQTLGTLSSVTIGGAFSGSAGMGSAAIGHVAVGNSLNTFYDSGLSVFAAAGEPVFTADAVALNPSYTGTGRFVRLCNEENISGSEVYGTTFSGDNTTMGAQLPDTYVNLLQQCADTDLSLLYEPRDQVGLAMRSRLSLYNQVPKLTLDAAQHQLSAQPIPLDDDTYTRNDITVSRVGGSSATQQQLTDSLNLQNPPNGVGDYSSNPPLSIGFDTELNDQAGWRLHMGTVDQPRYPSISLNLRYPAFTGNNDLMNAALGTNVGDRVVIINPPPWLPPDSISQIVQGYQESLGEWEHDITFNCSPESPYEIAVLDDPVLSVADTDGSTLTVNCSGNLNQNPSFSAISSAGGVLAGSLAGWAAKNGVITSVGGDSGTPLPSGSNDAWAVLLTPNGGGQSLVWQGDNSVTAYRFVATPGTQYRATTVVYSPGGYSSVQIGIDWWDGTGTYISTTSTAQAVSAGVWTGIHTVGNAPSNAATGSVNVGQNGTPTSANTLYVVNAFAWTGSITVATTGASSGSPLWTTNAVDFPFDVNIGGERMTVSSISGSSSPQTFAVTRAVNGVIKPQTAGTDVRLWQPMILSL